ncbi:MAG: YitT family protein [Anaerolineae bacterium]|nr:YitT family protein [Anaerolineae bacterium]
MVHPHLLRVYLLLVAGALLNAFAVVSFLVPADVVPTGATGAAVVLNTLVGLPVGPGIVLLNIPVLAFGARALPGGWPMLARTIFVIAIFSAAVAILPGYVPTRHTDDPLLSAVFGGLLTGIAAGIVQSTGTSFGGTSTLSILLHQRTGLPRSSTVLYADMGIVLAAGLLFGVEGALYALVVLFLAGMAADYVLTGPSVIHTVFIVTDQPEVVSRAVMNECRRGVTLLPARGMYTGKEHAMLYVIILRSQMHALQRVVAQADPRAFVVFGGGHSAYGGGFKMLKHAPRQESDPGGAGTTLPEDMMMETGGQPASHP